MAEIQAAKVEYGPSATANGTECSQEKRGGLNKKPVSPSSKTNNTPTLGIAKGIAVGWLVVNLPVLAIMLGSLLIAWVIEPRIWWLFLSGGFILAWTWWSHSVPRWRRWAHNRGANPDRLQKWAVVTGLVWPKGSRFEKTEKRLDD